ncbi:MAG: right-handed parallel beta-helix repeat-containing protein [Geobacteraceae bacterium]
MKRSTGLAIALAMLFLSSWALGGDANGEAVSSRAGCIDALSFPNLSVAITSTTTKGKTIVITRPQQINTISIPPDRGIKVEKGGSINVFQGNTLTINGPFEAGRFRVFAGEGRVILGEPNKSLTPVVYPQWWGVIPDDLASDDTMDFQKMLDDIGPAGQAIIDLGEGIYSIKSLSLKGFQGGFHFKGAGPVKTSIRYTDATSNIFDLTNSRFNRFTDIGFLPYDGARRTAGAVFYLGENSSGNTFENIRMGSPFNGFYLYKSSGNIFRNIDGLDYSNHAWHTMFTLEGNCASNWFYRCGLSTQQRAYAVFDIKKAADRTGADTVVISDCYGQKKGTNYINYGIKAGYGEFLHAKNNFFELGSAAGVGISLEGMNNVSLTDNHLVTNKYGLHITGGENITVSGGRLYRNGQNGLRLEGGKFVNITGVAFMDNGFTAANTHDQIFVAAGVSYFHIVGNSFGKVRQDKLLPRYGIYVADGPSDHYDISGNVIADYSIGDVYDGGWNAANKHISSFNENKPRVNAHTSTTNGMGKTLWSRTLHDNTTALISAKVLSQGANGTDRNAFIRSVVVYRKGGNAVIQGAVLDGGTIKSSAHSDCTFIASGKEIQLRVIGEAGKVIDWFANVEIIDAMDKTAMRAIPLQRH